jgi:YaiO family outer membrane protein
VDEARSRHPEDLDLVLLRLRLLAWAGRREEAWEGLAALPVERLEDPEILRFSADLAAWRGDDAEALRRYRLLLDRLPNDAGLRLALARVLERSAAALPPEASARRLAEALAALDEACALSYAPALAERDAFKARHWRFDLFAQAGWSFILDRADGQSGFLSARARVRPTWILGAEALHRRRDFGGGPLNDTLLSATLAHATRSGFVLDASAGATPDADFLPRLNLWVEPGWLSDVGVDARLRLWRMQYTDKGSSLLSPVLTFTTSPLSFTLRYFLSLDDTGERGDALLVRVLVAGEDRSAWVGVAGGDRADYLNALNANTDQFLSFFGGLGLSPNPRDAWRIDLSWRREVADAQIWRELELLGGYGRKF